MTGECYQLHTLSKGASSHSIELGDKESYLLKGIGSTSLELKSGGSIHFKNILYVPGTLYRLFTLLSQALFHLNVNPSKLRNRRYVHLHYNIFPSLNQMVYGIPKLKEDNEGTCKGCALGKNVKKPFARSDTISKEVLDLIHSDVCGPMDVTSLGGHQYYVTFIDDFSRKTWLYLLKKKYKVFEKFQEFKNEVENLVETKIKIL